MTTSVEQYFSIMHNCSVQTTRRLENNNNCIYTYAYNIVVENLESISCASG